MLRALSAVVAATPRSPFRNFIAPAGTGFPQNYAESRQIAEIWAKENRYGGVIEQQVAWGDIDSFQHLNNVATLRYFETARMIYMMSLLPELEEGSEEALVQAKAGVGIILSQISAKYRRPVTYPDTLLVGHRPTIIGKDRFTLESVVYSYKQRAVVTTGTVELVCYDHSQLRKADVPADLRTALEKRLPAAKE